jgi:diguanylate cyclase (GGDEF)-like protein
VLVVSDDAEWADRVATEALARGLSAEVTNLTAARASTTSAALVDVSTRSSADQEQALVLLEALTAREPPVATLVVADSGSFELRIEVARRGARAFLPKPVSPQQANDALHQLLEPAHQLEASVLAVDDDPQVLAVLAEVLSPVGLQVTTLEDPRRFWTVFERLRPDLLILDLDMPDVDGLDLCRVVRNDPRWRSLPILFLTVERDQAAVDRLFAAGADDYVGKPLGGPELLTRVRNRLERIRLHRLTSDIDPLTGLHNRRAASAQIARLLRLADRHREPLSLALVRLDQFGEINEGYGYHAGDDVLRQFGRWLQRWFRGEDVLARWGGDEFVLAMYGAIREDTIARLNERLAEWQTVRLSAGAGNDAEFTSTFSAGVAQHADDGRDVAALISAAEAALDQAGASARGQVVPAGWTAGDDRTVEACDAVIVEDDESLAALLVQALEGRGLRTRWIADGSAAAAALGGPDPSLRARVLLLDVNLPGMDGLSLLRHLGASGTLHRTRVIMLTLRSSEAETRQALALGAVDHVAKPFSLPILLQRVHRALEP